MEKRGLTRERQAASRSAGTRALASADIGAGVRVVVDLADDAVGRSILLGRFELNEIDFVRRTVKTGQHVVDVGAHVGLFTMHMAALVGPAGSVRAFEPFEPNAACLEMAIGQNGFAGRVFLDRAAVGSAAGTALLVRVPGSRNHGGAWVLPLGATVPPGLESSSVPVVTLDTSLLSRPVAFIKMDAEGSEPRIVAGASRLLREDRPVILSEVSPWQLEAVSGVAPAAFIAQLARLGYGCHLLGAGVVAEAIVDAPNNKTMSVVFVPR